MICITNLVQVGQANDEGPLGGLSWDQGLTAVICQNEEPLVRHYAHVGVISELVGKFMDTKKTHLDSHDLS